MNHRKKAIALHLIIILLIMIITVIVFYQSLIHLRRQIDEIKLSAVQQVKQISKDYDLLLESSENQLAEHLNRVMTELKEKLIISKKEFKLWELAKEFQIDVILETDMDGNILASSDYQLVNENIKTYIPDFEQFVQVKETQNKIIVDRVGLLLNFQKLFKTAWYIDPEENRVIMAARDFRHYLDKSRSPSFSNYLLRDYFDNVTRTVMMVSGISLYYEQNARLHTEGIESEPKLTERTTIADLPLAEQLNLGVGYVVIPYQLENMSHLNKLWLKINFDEEQIRRISMNLLLRTFFSFIILVIIVYLSLFIFFKNTSDEREKQIEAILNSIIGGSFSKELLEKNVFGSKLEKTIHKLVESHSKSNAEMDEVYQEKERTIENLKKQLENEFHKRKLQHNELTELRRNAEKLERYDKETGLPNYETITDYIKYERERSERDKKEFSLVILKLVNLPELRQKFDDDFAGYLLNKAGSKLTSLLRKQDQVGRWSLNEFICLLPGTHAEGLSLVINRIYKMMEETEFYREDRRIKVKVLLGGSVYRKGTKAEAFINQVQVAIKEAENSGSNAIIK